MEIGQWAEVQPTEPFTEQDLGPWHNLQPQTSYSLVTLLFLPWRGGRNKQTCPSSCKKTNRHTYTHIVTCVSLLCCSCCFAKYLHTIIHTKAIKAGKLDYPIPNSQPLIMNKAIILLTGPWMILCKDGILALGKSTTCKQPPTNHTLQQRMLTMHFPSTQTQNVYYQRRYINIHTHMVMLKWSRLGGWVGGRGLY